MVTFRIQNYYFTVYLSFSFQQGQFQEFCFYNYYLQFIHAILLGKLLNVREASHKQIMENKEITDLVKILGLTYKKKYSSLEDMSSLRYGRMMIMTDQVRDHLYIT